jgi:large subunit ribosomal protein L3
MVKSFWGKKIGMTQVFSEDKVIPVTVIDVSGWFVTQIKKKDSDGYDAVQIGKVKKKFSDEHFSAEWLKKSNYYFELMREIKVQPEENLQVGSSAEFLQSCTVGDLVDVAGITKGCGYAGVVRRHRFGGAPASHGHTMGKKPGALSFMRSRGRVIKGKRLPGQMGGDRRTMQNLQIVKIDSQAGIVAVKGSIPGRSGSLIYIEKA